MGRVSLSLSLSKRFYHQWLLGETKSLSSCLTTGELQMIQGLASCLASVSGPEETQWITKQTQQEDLKTGWLYKWGMVGIRVRDEEG